MLQDKVKAVEETPKQESAAVRTENIVSSAETASSSLVLKTLEELKKENVVFKERLDKQDETSKEIKGMLGKQEESNNQIKSLLEALFTRLPPPQP